MKIIKGKGMDERVRFLRERFVDRPREVNIGPILIIPEGYRENEEKPQVIKRALALLEVFLKAR
jgi:formate C-acetyltransferase